ncbi:hypothetical protein SDC9_77907 [bioreactor metagenome]|uniref:Uncharacterized protein n=1 Tax=bioreactor metagenome TaxID=1076179 RepID=A0A644YRY3_9ZZZZ
MLIEVHVGNGGHTALDALHDPKSGSKKDVPFIQQVFYGKYLGKPLLQGWHVVLIVAHQAHAQMGMRIDQGRHGQKRRCVDDTIWLEGGVSPPYECDMLPVDADISSKRIPLLGHGYNQGICDESFHGAIVSYLWLGSHLVAFDLFCAGHVHRFFKDRQSGDLFVPGYLLVHFLDDTVKVFIHVNGMFLVILHVRVDDRLYQFRRYRLFLLVAADKDLLYLSIELEEVFNLLRIDVLASLGDYQVLCPAFQVEIIFLIEPTKVPCFQPPLFIEEGFGILFILVVALGDVGSLNTNLPNAIPIRIGNLHLHQRKDHAHRFNLEVADRIEGEDGTGLGQPIALDEVDAQLLELLEYLRRERPGSTNTDMIVVKPNLAEQQFVEGGTEDIPMQILLGKAVDDHHGMDQGIGEEPLLFHLLHHARKQLVVEQGDSHEESHLALGKVVDHPADHNFLAKHTFSTVLDCLQQNRRTAIGVVQRQQGIQDIGFIKAEEDSVTSLIQVADNVCMGEHSPFLIAGSSTGKKYGGKIVFINSYPLIALRSRNIVNGGVAFTASHQGRKPFEVAKPEFLWIQRLYDRFVGKDEGRFNIAGKIFNPVNVQLVVQWDYDRSAVEGSQVGNSPGRAVFPIDDDTVAFFNPTLLQVRTHPFHLGKNLAEGQGRALGTKHGESVSPAEFLFGYQQQVDYGRPLSLKQVAAILVQFIPRVFHDKVLSMHSSMIETYYSPTRDYSDFDFHRRETFCQEKDKSFL